MGKNYNQNRKQTSQGIVCLTGLFLQSPYKHVNLAKKESALLASLLRNPSISNFACSKRPESLSHLYIGMG